MKPFDGYWLALGSELGLDDQTAGSLLNDLTERHAEPHRRYHTADHIEAVIRNLRDLEAANPTTLLAAFFHDAIYDATRSDNEAESAALLRDSLGALNRPEVDDAAAMILATAGHQLPDDAPAGTAAFLDADLAILAASAEIYHAYSRNIRVEYGHMTDADFRAGRIAVLSHFAEREELYFSTPGRARYESAARANLAMELASLMG